MKSVLSILFAYVFIGTCGAQVVEFGDTNSSSIGITHLSTTTHHYLIGHEKHVDSTHSDIVIYKLTKDLTPVDTLVYSTPKSDVVNEATWFNGNIVLAGSSVTLATTATNGLLVVMDTTGNIIHETTIQEPGTNIGINAVTTSDHQIALAGFISGGGVPADYFVVSFDSTFQEIWRYREDLALTNVANSITYSPLTNTFTVACDLTTSNNTIDIHVGSLSPTGQLLNETTWKDQLNGGCQKIITTSTGDLIIVGESYPPNNPAFDVVIARLDTNLLFKSYDLIPGTILGEASFDITELANSHFLLTGYAADTAINTTGVLFLEVDTSLSQLRKHIYRTSGTVSIGYTIEVDNSTGEMVLSGVANGSANGYFIIADSTNLIGANPLFIASPTQDQPVTLYPNPTRSLLCVARDQLQVEFVELYNQRGQLVFNTHITNEPYVTLEGLPKGIYFAIVKTSHGRHTEKIILQ